MTRTKEVLLSLIDVGRRFQMGEVSVEVLRHISLDIYHGEFLVMVGPSGSGKTTLLNIIGGMDVATSGRALYRGRDLSTATLAELTRFRRESVGFVFQFYNLVPNLTARENVLVSTEIARDPLGVDETLDLVGLGERKNHFPSQLSGGEQQRVAIARALAKNPQMLLCDEPTGSLDLETGKKVLGILADARRRWGKTVLLVTHNSAIAPLADRVIHLSSGELHLVEENANPVSPEAITW